MIGLLMVVGEVIRGAQAPRLPVSAPSPKHPSLTNFEEVRAGEGAGTSRRGACAPRTWPRRPR